MNRRITQGAVKHNLHVPSIWKCTSMLSEGEGPEPGELTSGDSSADVAQPRVRSMEGLWASAFSRLEWLCHGLPVKHRQASGYETRLGAVMHSTPMLLGVQLLSHVQLFATPWTVAHQAPLSMGLPSKNTGVGCHFLLQGIIPTQGSTSCLLHLLHWQADSLPLSHPGRFHTYEI